MAHRIPPASGTEYVPLGPCVEDPPTKMTEAIETMVVNRSMGMAPAHQIFPRVSRRAGHTFV